MILAQLINGGLTRIQNSLAQGESILGISSALVSTFTTTLLKSDSREKSSNILISQQDLKNQFLSFFCPQIALRQIRNLIKIVPAVGLLFVRTITSVFDVGVADCPNSRYSNIKFPRVCKRSRMEKFGHFLWTETLFCCHQKIRLGQQRGSSL